MGEVEIRFSLTGSHSPNQTFLKATYSFFFSIYYRNIYLTSFFTGSLAGN